LIGFSEPMFGFMGHGFATSRSVLRGQLATEKITAETTARSATPNSVQTSRRTGCAGLWQRNRFFLVCLIGLEITSFY
jgi:hypothetical protein